MTDPDSPDGAIPAAVDCDAARSRAAVDIPARTNELNGDNRGRPVARALGTPKVPKKDISPAVVGAAAAVVVAAAAVVVALAAGAAAAAAAAAAAGVLPFLLVGMMMWFC